MIQYKSNSRSAPKASMKTETTYKGFKLVTYKERKGGYTTYVFRDSVKSINKFYALLKRHSLNITKNRIDNEELLVQ